MSALASLLPMAMVGAERQPVTAPALGGEIGALAQAVAAAAGDDTERMLHLAAIVAACTQAGSRGRTRTGELPAAAPREALRPVSDPRQVALLRWLFEQGPTRLQVRVFGALAAAATRLPDILLPAALDSGQQHRELRPALLAVIGERGRWLAQFSDTWRFAAGAGTQSPIELRWAEGSLDERRVLLAEERRASPLAARERLAATLAELPARERAELLGALAVNLSQDDEPFLEGLLQDRSREVRQLATSLLASLPQSALAQRAGARLDALLSQERVKLRRSWVIDAPQAAAAQWKDDGIDSARPQGESLGERAWWMYQLARQVPLAWWGARLQMTPAETLKWAVDGAWGEALIRAWRDQLAVSRDPAWCEAILDDWPEKYLRDEPASVLSLLPPARREKYWEKQLKGGWLGRPLSIGSVAAGILSACPPGETLSPQMSRRILDALAGALKDDSLARDYALREALPELCVIVAAETIDRVKSLPFAPDAAPALLDVQQRISQICEIRAAFGC